MALKLILFAYSSFGVVASARNCHNVHIVMGRLKIPLERTPIGGELIPDSNMAQRYIESLMSRSFEFKRVVDLVSRMQINGKFVGDLVTASPDFRKFLLERNLINEQEWEYLTASARQHFSFSTESFAAVREYVSGASGRDGQVDLRFPDRVIEESVIPKSTTVFGSQIEIFANDSYRYKVLQSQNIRDMLSKTLRGIELAVDRDSHAYQSTLKYFREIDVGGRNGGSDQSIVADLLHSRRTPNTPNPVFVTGDAKLLRGLLRSYLTEAEINILLQELKAGRVPIGHHKVRHGDRFILNDYFGAWRSRRLEYGYFVHFENLTFSKVSNLSSPIDLVFVLRLPGDPRVKNNILHWGLDDPHQWKNLEIKD